ncbi:hypothetical protein ACVBBN_003536, partial [Escherichia coli]
FLKELFGVLLCCGASDCVRVFMEWQTLAAVILQKCGNENKNSFNSLWCKGIKFCFYAFFTCF